MAVMTFIQHPLFSKRMLDKKLRQKTSMKKYLTLGLSGLAIYFFLCAPLAAKAVADSSIVAQPAKVEISLQPGQKTKKTVMAVNRSNSFAKLKVYVKDYRVDSYGKVELYDKLPINAVKWLVPQFSEISLMPLESKAVQFIVTAPEDMEAGGHYASIVFEPENSQATGQNKTFGELVLLTIAKEGITTGLKLDNFSIGALQNPNPIQLDLNIKNMGNTHFTAKGSVAFTDIFGRQAEQFDLGELLVYPENSRNFSFKWNSHPLFGIYKAKATLTNPLEQGKNFTSEKWFVILPASMPVMIFAGILCLLVLALVVFAFLRLRAIRPARKLSVTRR